MKLDGEGGVAAPALVDLGPTSTTSSSAPLALQGVEACGPSGAAVLDARLSPSPSGVCASSLSARGSEFDQEQLEAFCDSTLKLQARAVVQSDGRVELLWTKAAAERKSHAAVQRLITTQFPWITALSTRVVKTLPGGRKLQAPPPTRTAGLQCSFAADVGT